MKTKMNAIDELNKNLDKVEKSIKKLINQTSADFVRNTYEHRLVDLQNLRGRLNMTHKYGSK